MYFLTNGMILHILFSTLFFSLNKIGYLGGYPTSEWREHPLILRNSFIVLQCMKCSQFYNLKSHHLKKTLVPS